MRFLSAGAYPNEQTFTQHWVGLDQIYIKIIFCVRNSAGGCRIFSSESTPGGNVPRLLNNPAHWNLRAQEAQLLASQLEDPVAKAATLKIAEEYERLAARAARREHVEADKPNGRREGISTGPRTTAAAT
jgi:hypothetical protein